MLKFNRRHFLALSTAVLASQTAAKAQPTNPDVIVIGAGAAGIAAARELSRSEREVIVLEANNRIGGRIHTDTSTFGVPFDLGAHWLHNGQQNPFVKYGRRNGFSLYRDPGNQRLFVGNQPATRQQEAAFDAALQKANNAIERAGGAGRDVSAASVMPELGVWGKTARFQIGPFEMGKDLTDFSCSDWYTGSSGTDWFCSQGFGALWRHSARDVPVQLNTKVNVIRWDGIGVRVETNRGTLQARACIVTVSTGVLAANGIRFVPALPVKKKEAFTRISMGLYNHVALKLDAGALGLKPDTYVGYKVDPNDRGAVGFLANVSGSGLMLADLGGGFARSMEAAGKRAAIDFVTSQLGKTLGSNAVKMVRKATVTTWGRDPLTRGSYASAKPGAQGFRRVLREPVGNRIWFAGEACSTNEWATVAGAHKNGQHVAKKVAGAIG